MLKIYVFFVLAVVAVLFVTGKHKFKICCNTQFPQTYLEFLEIKATEFSYVLKTKLNLDSTEILVPSTHLIMNRESLLLLVRTVWST